MEALALRNEKEVGGRREREDTFKKEKKRGRSKGKFEWFLCTRRKLGERQTTVWTFQGGDNLVNYSSGLMMRFGKVSWTKFLVTISGQRTFAPSWEQNSTWADARIPSVSPLAFAPRSRSKSLPFHLLNLSRATSETVLHYIFVFEKKIHEIFVNQDEQRVLPIIVWTAIAVRLVKHDPWSSPASDVTVHDVILHSFHSKTQNQIRDRKEHRKKLQELAELKVIQQRMFSTESYPWFGWIGHTNRPKWKMDDACPVQQEL